MRSSKLKKVIVKCLDWREEVEINSEDFDDIYMEAATRVIEKNRKTPNFSVEAIIECYEKKDLKNLKKHSVYNTYFVLVNAALYEQAEMLRMNFLKAHNIDLKKESLKGDDGPGSTKN